MALNNILALLKEEENFVLSAHINPEGDAIGSCLAMAEVLRNFGKNATVYSRDPIPEIYKFLPGWEKITSSLPPNTRDFVLLLLDCARTERAGISSDVQFKKIAVIDHHEIDCPQGEVCWIEPDASATGLMIYKLAKRSGVPISKDMAVNLYTAISTDTGMFRYDNTTPEAFDAAAQLVRTGASPSQVAENIFETWTKERMHLLCLALSTLEVRNGVAVIAISRDMFKKTGTILEDTEFFTAFPRMLKDVKIAAIITEIQKGQVRGSIRSKGNVNVRPLAEMFGGGGHMKASGYRVNGNLKEAKEAFFKAAAQLLHSNQVHPSKG